MTDTAALVAQSRSYRDSWFPSGRSLSAAQRAEQAELMHLAALSMPRPKGLTASQHEDRRAALMAAAEPYRNPDLLRRVAGAHRPTEFRSRTNSYQAEIGRVFDTVMSRRADTARAELRAGLLAYQRDEAARITAALDQRVGEHAQTLMDGLNRRVKEILERKRRLRPQGPVRLF